MRKPGITINIPGFGKVQINSILSDYTGTLACGGKLVLGVKERLLRLAERVDIHIVTADSFGTAEEELKALPLVCRRLKREKEDVQKAHCAVEMNPYLVS
jgi:soluble P-type ATPase